ncbi:hypothetical protein SK128_001951 [Halocaridina rubra]|uniref:Uncharacterized protein n=1 Tax=Halocaridina rubra TaxID=373956 RepID=A0AAN9A7H3_HALRR
MLCAGYRQTNKPIDYVYSVFPHVLFLSVLLSFLPLSISSPPFPLLLSSFLLYLFLPFLFFILFLFLLTRVLLL